MPPGQIRGLLLAAPASGAGKTLVALGLMRALADRGLAVAPAKSGPDYIDPQFHALAARRVSVNLDAWAMDPVTLRARAAGAMAAAEADMLLVEGAMGVLDGARPAGEGSAADLAIALGLPVVLVIDIRHMAQSAPLALAGLAALRSDLAVAGAILNRAASAGHGALAQAAVEAAGFPVLGVLGEDAALALPSRHLGLVPAAEHDGAEAFIARAGAALAAAVDLDRLRAAAAALQAAPGDAPRRLPPPGQRVAVARDIAFAFAYPHLLEDWRVAGAEILPFSPLADQAPEPGADAVFLPGGYPELHAGRLAAAAGFRAGMQRAASAGLAIYGECGGYMVLGERLTDAEGTVHPMLGLLPLATSFARRRLHLGYRRLTALGGPWRGGLFGHEFHYATVLEEGPGDPLFAARDAAGNHLQDMGRIRGNVAGSFAHIIAPAP